MRSPIVSFSLSCVGALLFSSVALAQDETPAPDQATPEESTTTEPTPAAETTPSRATEEPPTPSAPEAEAVAPAASDEPVQDEAGQGEPVEAEPVEDESALARILQGLSWGDTTSNVIDYYQREYLEDYRADIAGMRDTVRIDQIRRSHNDRLERVRESQQSFEGTRTGYEASVLSGEIVAGNDEGLLTVRTENANLYYVFASDQLFKIVVAYNSSYLGGLSFEAFLDQVERRYGPSEHTEMGETTTGLRYLARAKWEEGDTRLRIENHSNLFGTFIMVFTNAGLEDRVVRLRGDSGTSSGAVEVSDLVRSLGAQQTDDGRYSDIVDQIIGHETEVELSVPEAAPVDLTITTQTESEEEEEGAEAEETEEATPRRRRQPAEEEEEQEEEGITIY